MAEGSVEEDTGEMLGPTLAPVIHTMHTPVPSNLSSKDEESDCESSVGSPEPASLAMGADTGTDLSMTTRNVHQRLEAANATEQTVSPNSSATAHINGTMAGLVSLQNLQNLASLQNLPQVASLAAGLSNMANLSGNPVVNAPLNLSVSASATIPRSNQLSNMQESPGIMTNPMNSQPPTPNAMQPSNPLLTPQQPATMPQFILASGHLVQGIQGAQLLIPTSQGLATQTILTIPVNHVNSTDQMVNLALNNGQVMQTSLANLQAMAQTNLLNTSNTPVPPTSNGHLMNPATLTHLLSNGSAAQQLLQTLPQMLNNHHSNPNPPPIMNPLSQPLLSTTPTSQPGSQLRSQRGPSPMSNSPISAGHMTAGPLNPSQMNSSHYADSKLHNPSMPINAPADLMNGGRIASNGEIHVATSHGNSASIMKRSPSSLSPNCTDSSTADLLVDSPNQPTINQTNSNVVDGINLDEIKDFAKAFKLRRLSLGLTQTQVGQALSVTEGPAYSQSAICSALASQMFAAAQLSTQQQAMFEKLDITPKSAQKIKPVLERWMKEAEDSLSRYKSGQNHLTDFIGMEPSKKRKRRTSFTPQALELLNAHFERNTHPSGTEITGLAHQLGYEREVIRIWFCNKRQALKNTVRMMSKGMV
ncbi:unnamed protein product [Phaedon cochleariae]|uniref:POU domain protein n=1 Tax=Phaedon cochleariae TaxID=80249 RepID=A0A9P0DPE6_PHACE|nr:unnamed protein product [Phaedon cochleariae]